MVIGWWSYGLFYSLASLFERHCESSVESIDKRERLSTLTTSLKTWEECSYMTMPGLAISTKLWFWPCRRINGTERTSWGLHVTVGSSIMCPSDKNDWNQYTSSKFVWRAISFWQCSFESLQELLDCLTRYGRRITEASFVVPKTVGVTKWSSDCDSKNEEGLKRLLSPLWLGSLRIWSKKDSFSSLVMFSLESCERSWKFRAFGNSQSKQKRNTHK
jgi:hypothetical protein